MHRVRVIQALAPFVVAACLGPADPGARPTTLASVGLDPSAPAFGQDLIVDAALGATEPSLVVDPEGRVFVVAPTDQLQVVHEGRLLQYNEAGVLWRSLDAGRSFERVAPIALGLYGPSFGGGDSDLAVDDRGRLTMVDLWLGNVGTLASTDHGATWLAGTPVTFAAPVDDRPWVDVDRRTGDVYVVVHAVGSGLWVAKSRDGGQTFPQQTLVASYADINRCICMPGVLAVDESTGNVYVPVRISGAGTAFAVSTDGGASFSLLRLDALKRFYSTPAVVAHDAEGNLYLVSLQGAQVALVVSRDHGRTWSAALRPAGASPSRHLFPWVVAGDAGRIAVAWYEQTTREGQSRWDVQVALSRDALSAQPTFGLHRLNGAPILTGDSQRSAFGDFFEIAVGPDGAIHAAWSGRPDGASTAVLYYARQVGGEGLRAGVPVLA